MAVVNSSLIGANLAATGDTQLFALGTTINATDGSTWEYVSATATFITGEFVLITPPGSAYTLLTSLLTGANTRGQDIAVFQGLISQGEYGWVAKQGRNLYVLCTGTVTAGGEPGVAFSANSGRLESGGAAGVGQTCFGVFITTSASTATESVAVATLTWPRNAIHR